MSEINPIDLMAAQLSEKVAAQVMQKVSQQLSSLFKAGIKFSYTETEAADILNMEPATLAKIRKAGAIEFSQTIAPPAGKAHGGRIVYMLHHLVNYLVRNERRPLGSKPVVSVQDVFGENVVNLQNYKKAS